LLHCLVQARKLRATAVLAVFPKEEYLLAAYLTARWTGARLYPYLHNTYLENRAGSARRFAQWLQPAVFDHAAHVFVMSEGMAELYRRSYPGLACSPLVHSFNEDIPEYEPPPPPRRPLRVTLCGNINASCLDAAQRTVAAVAQDGGAQLTVLSGTALEYLRSVGVVRDGTRYDTVSRDEVVDRLREADVLLLAHGFSGVLSRVEYQTIFPTRTIEYLISGRPILAHAPSDSFLARFLQQHGCALVVTEPTVEAVRAGIDRLRSDPDLRASLVRNALSAAEMFRAPTVAAELRARIEHPAGTPTS
jgi:glycosyltransferase involved in cell wall biosynthesis